MDIDKLQDLAQKSVLIPIFHTFGDVGIEAYKQLTIAIRRLFFHLAPEKLPCTLVICKFTVEGIHIDKPSPAKITDLEYALSFIDTCTVNEVVLLEVIDERSYQMWKIESVNCSELSVNALVYRISTEQEQFIVDGKELEIFNPSPLFASIFSIPTFRSLEDALERYKHTSARFSRCRILKSCWVQNEMIYYQNKPERIMRDSLLQFLEDVLRDAEIRPEQTVDESHPIDIKVTWLQTKRIALIEIKWLGNSITHESKFTSYSQARALEGAKQLADYLDLNKIRVPTHQTMGYLVVFDGRRRGVTPETTSMSCVDGLWYEYQEVKYAPEYHYLRGDFAEPLRFFMMPICTS